MNANRFKTRPRRGYTLVELAIAVIVLMTAMGVTVKVIGWNAHERRAADRREWALQTASNVLERVSAEPFDRVTLETVRATAAATAADRALPGAAWEITVDDDRGAPVPARRIALQLRWKERSGDLAAPVRLTSWVYRRGASK